MNPWICFLVSLYIVSFAYILPTMPSTQGVPKVEVVKGIAIMFTVSPLIFINNMTGDLLAFIFSFGGPDEQRHQ